MKSAHGTRIARRFLKSIRIDSDLGDPHALDGFVCPQSSVDVLLTMARHVAETKHGAFTWTGPYGSGKSSLVVALSALVNGKSRLQKQAKKVFGRELSRAIWNSLPPGVKGWRIVPVVGRRGDPVGVIGEALQTAGLAQRRPRGGWTEDKLVTTIRDVSSEGEGGYGGVIVFIDEMGKFLEAAAKEQADIYVFQQLAEAAARSDGRLLIVGILHQAFEEYAHRLSHELRDEWAKIQGRFIDLAVNIAGDEQIDLISRAIENDRKPAPTSDLARSVARIARRDRPAEADQLAIMLDACWPLHPVVPCLLGPISRRRFGQNQRSIFGFLNSAEPHGFQEFLRRDSDDAIYYPDQLWDYLRANLEPSILASPDGHRWALAAESLERCESLGGDEIHLRLLKTVATIDLFKERSGLLANEGLLQACIPEASHQAIAAALSDLSNWSLIIFRKFLDAYAVFAGSDFDIDRAITVALEDVDEIDFEALTAISGFQPILAKRHYHETGSQRWFEVILVPVCDLPHSVTHAHPNNGIVGQFMLAIPTSGENEDLAKHLCREAARHDGDWDIVAGISKSSWAIETLARELVALENVRNDRSELAGDPVARREVTGRLATLQGQIETELHKALDGALWFRKHYKPKHYRQAQLNSLASDLADHRFAQSPRLHNELLNRQKPSGSAIAGQNALLRRMVMNEGAPRLGIDGFPAEGGLLTSILESTGLYAERPDGWRFVEPQGADPHRLVPLWEATAAFIRTHAARSITVSEIYELWRRPPYGVKEGLMPILVVAFILSQRNRIALYRDGVFRAHFYDVDVQYLAKDPTTIQLRWMDLSAASRNLLSEMADLVRALDTTNELVHLEPIDVARGLVAIYESLPPWTKRTMQLSTNAVRVRELFKRARDPNQFLFDDIPATLGAMGRSGHEDSLQLVVEGVREGLEELVQAYPSMLHRLRDLMLAELQVPNVSPQSLAELRDRAHNVRQLAGDFHLEAFVGRLAHFDGSDIAFEGIASLAASKPPRDWVDPDLDRSAVDLAEMSQKFLRAETFARIKGRPQKRQAMAVVIGMQGRPVPLLEEFDIADVDRAEVNKLVSRMMATLEQADTSRRNIILAALAELSAQFMQSASKPEKNKKGRAVS